MVIVRNLLSNAIKFTPKGGRVSVSAHHENGYTTISVADTGVGMSDKQVAALFAEEASNSTLGTGKEKGAGLGLLLCKEFVEFHKGRISVESKPGAGTTFNLILPKNQNY